jgi:predicted DNA-binding transcriptional regulator YafY
LFGEDHAMRASRLLSLLILLQLRGRLTAEALAEEFEVSVRTIYRDMDALSAAGVPLYGDRGPGGGFQLLDGYRTRLTGLAADEVEAMFMIGLPGPASALGLGAAARAAGNKLLAALPAGATEGAGRIASRFHLDPVDWYRAAEPVACLPELARAVLNQKRLSMTYESWSNIRTWAAEPLGLVMKGGAWYLVAVAGGRARIFRASNLLDLTVLDEGFERPADFVLPTYWAAELERFEARLRPTSARLRASPTGLARLARLGAWATAAVEAAGPPDPEGWRGLSLPVESVEDAALMLLGVGPELEVLDPPPLRRRIADLAEAVAQRSR